jgi:serine/threonine-protein kinase HipA
MARAAGIDMMPCRLMEENGRAHFMTRRFDRRQGAKIHMQSLCGLAHYDFNQAGAYSYEQAFAVMRKLRLGKPDAIEQYRRMVFNVIARNQDDHTKNIAFLLDRNGRWRLSPAFDVIYAHNPAGVWTNQHQMSLNGKRDGFSRGDLITVGESISIPQPGRIIDKVLAAVNDWPKYAQQAGVKPSIRNEIARHHRNHDVRN